jgi:hypothetical protein
MDKDGSYLCGVAGKAASSGTFTREIALIEHVFCHGRLPCMLSVRPQCTGKASPAEGDAEHLAWKRQRARKTPKILHRSASRYFASLRIHLTHVN